MLRICLVFWESEPQYAYKLYAYKKKTCTDFDIFIWLVFYEIEKDLLISIILLYNCYNEDTYKRYTIFLVLLFITKSLSFKILLESFNY